MQIESVTDTDVSGLDTDVSGKLFPKTNSPVSYYWQITKVSKHENAPIYSFTVEQKTLSVLIPNNTFKCNSL